jgi:hypothetical protein
VCAAEPPIREKPSWERIAAFGPFSVDSLTWCGSKGLVIRHFRWGEKEDEPAQGGIAYVDVTTKKIRWITKDARTIGPFPSYDGSSVFFLRLGPSLSSDEERPSEGIWRYNLKRQKAKRISKNFNTSIRCPASPSGDVFALVAPLKSDLDAIGINLPGWKILRLANEELNSSTSASQWASDGSYLILDLWGKENGRRLSFFDSNGVHMRDVKLELPLAWMVKARPDAAYFFLPEKRELGLNRISLKIWAVEPLPLKVPYDRKHLIAFDVSLRGEIVYDRLDGGIRISSLPGKGETTLSEKGIRPSFSGSGEYVAFIEQGANREDTVVVMRRVE